MAEVKDFNYITENKKPIGVTTQCGALELLKFGDDSVIKLGGKTYRINHEELAHLLTGYLVLHNND